ncbi:(Fe-S)-binding protein [Thiorhodococcus mannitoliphagus]|uniref:(Fe-S)-binding protein n=1 Tax=Thiorhodococcus mannitoliphagus TaxID=329406 RepID=A0A6P1E318_9GAMM|nr:4Fe-4S dicluster domain-containing protein [Thiorhodococcus mannitoliphagus]NEX22085.1 (Fe-S)-binding protein [Thiorhodococcus mannitoliphagus]
MKTHLDWSAYKDAGMGDAYADIPKHGGDFAKAVAVCINSRQCESQGKQVMCPSFKVTGNPNLSTGGRVRLLKTALSSDLAEEALADPTLAEAMDLCVACKGCKRECEANVDMALIKAEYLAQRTARSGPSLRGRLFAQAPRWLHRASWLRALIRWRNRRPWLARLSERVLGLSAERPLPEPVDKPFRASQTHASAPLNAGEERPEVVLLVDTFTRYFEPDIAEAAIRVLEAGGYRVEVAEPSASTPDPERPLCCGRTYLAQGMVEASRAEAKRLVDAVLPHIEAGRMLVGLEASCVLGLREDAQALGLGETMERVGGHILLFEEFLARETMAGRLKLPLKALGAGETLVHGHCHQKAVGAMKSMRRVLKLIPEHDFAMIDAGCCGMAGTFGLESEHAALAGAMAEQGLMPALRDKPSARVVANGFSCRQQMQALGDERPRHLAVLLAEALADA